MATQDFVSLRDAAEMTGENYQTIGARVRRLRQDDPQSDFVRVETGERGGKDRVFVAMTLVDQWLTGKADRDLPGGGGARDQLDHLRTENELAQQSARHAEIRMQHLELKTRDDQIAALQADNQRLETKIENLEAEKATLHGMLVEALGNFIS